MPAFNPDRIERIRITFRDEKDQSKRDLRFDLPSRLALPFHWWLTTFGIQKT